MTKTSNVMPGVPIAIIAGHVGSQSASGTDPHIIGEGTGYIEFPDETDTINLAMPSEVAGLSLREGGAAELFAGLITNAYLLLEEDWSRIVVPMTPADLSDEGLSFEIGGVGRLYLAAKDAATIQLYPLAGGFSVEFTDRDGGLFRHVAEDAGVAIPSLGMLPQYSSAPSSPVEGQSYYNLTTHKAYTWDGTTWQAWW